MSKICMGCMETYDEEFEICPKCGYVEGTKATEALHMEPGSILKDRYIIGKVLGFGGFGVTYIGWDALLEQKVAIKEYLPSEFSTRTPGQTEISIFNGVKHTQFNDGLAKFIEEAQRLAKFHQTEGIVKIFDSFEANKTAYIIMEYLEGETITKFLKREHKMASDQAIKLLLPIIRSLIMVHEDGIIHRDIAPDNIILTKNGEAKLIDFGASRYATTTFSRSLSVIIKPGYSPEEQYRSRGDQGSYTDVYAIGATLYNMITGIAPPDALERRASFEGKQKDILKPITKFCKNITSNQETAILNALNIRIEDRTPDLETLMAELTSEKPVVRKHEKIKKIDMLKWPLWAKVSVPVASIAIVTLSVLFVFGFIGIGPFKSPSPVPDNMAMVPSVVKDDLETADERLKKVALSYKIEGKDYSKIYPENLVINQDINAGTIVLKNSIIKIIISSGAERNTIPDVLGINQDEARKQLEDLKFVVQTNSAFSNFVAKNMVVSLDKDIGSEVEVDSTVTLTISQGPESPIPQKMTKVPNFAGMTYKDALAEAKKAGFLLAVKSKEYSAEFEKNLIMSQSVAAGENSMSGNTIELVVSLGKETIKIKDVQYKTEEEAKTILEGQKLKTNITYEPSESVAEGLVIRQEPLSGTSANTGDEVKLVVSTGGVPFPMINVAGMNEEQAKSELSAKGLSVSVEYRKDNNVATGNVISQNIAANNNVKKGTNITIVISSGKDVIAVQNVVGLNQNSASNALRSQGLGVTISEAYSDTVEKGVVISQYPTAGSSQESGATIALTISKGKEVIAQTTTNQPSQPAIAQATDTRTNTTAVPSNTITQRPTTTTTQAPSTTTTTTTQRPSTTTTTTTTTQRPSTTTTTTTQRPSTTTTTTTTQRPSTTTTTTTTQRPSTTTTTTTTQRPSTTTTTTTTQRPSTTTTTTTTQRPSTTTAIPSTTQGTTTTQKPNNTTPVIPNTPQVTTTTTSKPPPPPVITTTTTTTTSKPPPPPVITTTTTTTTSKPPPVITTTTTTTTSKPPVITTTTTTTTSKPPEITTTTTQKPNTTAPATTSGNGVPINNNGLENYIRQTVGKPTGDILPTDLAKITAFDARSGSYNLPYEDISLLQYTPNLVYLQMDGNQGTGSDFSKISRLTHLQALAIKNMGISNITFVSNLRSLVSLDLSGNNISSISSLSSLTSLDTLYLNNNRINDISSLRNLRNLTWLQLRNNNISSISALSTLVNINHLALDGNRINDFSPLKNLVGLQIVDVSTTEDNVNKIRGFLPNCQVNNW